MVGVNHLLPNLINITRDQIIDVASRERERERERVEIFPLTILQAMLLAIHNQRFAP
jgi:hypothetical protein